MLDKIKEMVAENLGVDAATITEESSFKDDLGADSLDLFELVMALEEEFGWQYFQSVCFCIAGTDGE